MNEIIYLEPDEDITGVIARVKETDSQAVSLVIPRGGSIAQSIVNLKLIKREIEKLGKAVSLVTKDKISKNLASQVGMTVFAGVSEAQSMKAMAPSEPEQIPLKPEGFSTNGIKINQYSREAMAPEANAEEIADDEAEAIDNDEEEDAETEAGERHEKSKPDDDDEENDVINAKVEQQRSDLAHARPIEKPKIVKPQDEGGKVAKKNISSRRKPAMIIVSVLLLILIIASAIFYPSANVKVTLATSNIEATEALTADKSVAATDFEKMAVPAKEYTEENTSEKTFNTTGKKDVGTKASGEITFYNDYDPTNTVSIANGVVLTAAGKSFVLDGAITIPTATIISLYPLKTTPGQIKGKVVAKENGDGYNIAASKFTVNSFSGVKQEKVYGQSTSALTGGTTKEINIVSDEDLANAKKNLADEIETTAKAALTQKGEQDQFKLVASSITKSEGDYIVSKNSGDEADTFIARYTLKFTELGFSETQLRECVIKKIESGLKTNEMLVNPDGTELAYDITGVDNVKGTIGFSAKFVGKIGNKIESSVIQDMLVRAKYGSAEGKIEAVSGVKDATISINPNFWPMLPFLKQRIKVSFDYEKE